MASKNRVVWREGISVAPQHFQQLQRHIDYMVTTKIETFGNYCYGFDTIAIDMEYLKIGRIGIKEAKGIMPDGTLFEMPYQDNLPAPIEIKYISGGASQNIYLALPIANDIASEVDTAQEDDSSSQARYQRSVQSIRDVHTQSGVFSKIEVAQLAPKLIQGNDSDSLSSYTLLPICRIKEIHSDGVIILDEHFIPTISKVKSSPYLMSFLNEITGLITERANQLAQKIGSPTQQGVAGIAEFLMLQLLNSTKPLFKHLSHTKNVHPEQLYLQLTRTCSELMTFTDENRLAPEFVIYDHDDLHKTFFALIGYMRKALSIVLTARAISIPLSINKNGVFIGVINDSELLHSASFVLAVKAQLPQDQLIRLFIQQTKISSPQKIHNLVHLQLPGILLTPLSAAPPQLPFHAGYNYFQLDTATAEWGEIVKSNGIAFHVSGNFPELDLQFWAIRSN